ncbi:hypothetical protein MtrunA17_Chr2g0325191 [Medicago truncatula]|uniref:Uncharacterized protein n=1 Tax=Medicago truncatula TaxID=3880 RepID=G7ZVJ4_MEDTR|nr:hypothetical protein MTR_2g090975 [Medicago truncatula]RHN75801.1 hypothetical protein MtrunA17_Chr2g0325191 [Medicago truncatula]
MSIGDNKENIPPVYTNGENKKKNSISIMASSFKKNSSKRKMKRVPLADITNLFENSSTLTTTREENVFSSASVHLGLNFRRTLRIGFR